MIGRISAASPQTTNTANRSFGLAAKIFPTVNPDEVVHTANFFAIHDLNGTPVDHVLDVAYVNEPPVRLEGAVKILNGIFAMADIHPGVRPVYPIARAGMAQGLAPVSPRWMRIRTAPGVQSANAVGVDFRDELSAKNYPDGVIFLIDVSDTTKDPKAQTGWQNIGKIRTAAMTTTFGCDRRLHFPHPTFNDPAN